MRLQCDRQELLEATAHVGRAVSAKSTIPALEGILLRASSGRLTLSAYDMELGITTSIEAAVEEDGALVVSARLFGDIIRKLDGDTVSLSAPDLSVIIKGGMAEFSVIGTPADDFPEMPLVSNGTSIEIPASLLAGMVRQTLFAVAQTEAKPVHTGVLFEMDGEMLRLVALDGYRLALRQEKLHTDEPISFVVPGKTLGEVVRLLGSDDDTPISLLIGQRHITFSIEHYAIVSRLLSGEFLDYRQSIAGEFSTEVRVRTQTMIDSVERASLLISDRLKSPVRCVFDENEVRVSCVTSLGKVRDRFDAAVSGDLVEIGFNNRYLIEALRAAETDEVCLRLGSAIAPMKIVPVDGDHFLFLVLPVRLKND